MRFIFVDINSRVCDAFRTYFGKYKNTEVFQGRFQDIPEFDCMVSPANSYGSLTGGVDLHIRNYFGKKLEDEIQAHIREHYYGEQPVGTSFIIETGHPLHPYLAHTPTMRVPMDIRGQYNVYNAMRALMIALLTYNREKGHLIQTVACTGFGTMVGKMEPEQAIRQMELAYRTFVEPTPFTCFADLYEKELELAHLIYGKRV